jgi:hypothetical protein
MESSSDDRLSKTPGGNAVIAKTLVDINELARFKRG